VLHSVIKELKDRKNSLLVAIADGAAKDYAEYKNIAGEIRGLSFAVALLEDLVRQMESSDE
jgi:hypothetical protein